MLPRMKPVLAMLIASTAFAADFPDPASLPPQPGLPDPLVMRDGTRVADKEAWISKRAPELRALFEHYMYGVRPPKPRGVNGEVIYEDKSAFGGKATLRVVTIKCLPQEELKRETLSKDSSKLSVGYPLVEPIQLLLVIPHASDKPRPTFLGMNFNGNYQLVDDVNVPLPRWARAKKAGEPNVPDPAARGREKETWALEQSISRGYAVATFYSGDVVPDDKALAEDVLKGFRDTDNERRPADTATIMAWAWGFSRMVDYLATVPEVDAKRVAVVGHSRNGKTALLAAAFDERIAMAIPSQAGCGGTAPSRVAPELAKPNEKGRPTAETVAVINGAFPHWFAGNFKHFNDAPEKLPFDQHELIALCAPRPVFLSNAEEDLWANPDGQYAMLKAAAPVYALFGETIALTEQRPAMSQPLLERLAYYIRPGKHSMTSEDWKVWLDYADKWLK
jgi:dienelactone hydrolase